jgi:hypothetical protein
MHPESLTLEVVQAIKRHSPAPGGPGSPRNENQTHPKLFGSTISPIYVARSRPDLSVLTKPIDSVTRFLRKSGSQD